MTTNLLTKREAASRVRVSERTIDRILANDPTLPATRIGRRVLIAESALDDWLNRQARTTTSATEDQR